MATKKQLRIEDSIPELLNEYAEIQSRISDDQVRMAEIENELSLLDPGTYSGYGADTVMVSGYTRFNTAKAMRLLSDRSKAKVMVARPSAALIREHFPGVARKATDRFGNRVSIDVQERRLIAVED